MDERTVTFERIWEIFQEYRTLLYFRARRITDNTELAEEALEEALVRVLEHWEKLTALTDDNGRAAFYSASDSSIWL